MRTNRTIGLWIAAMIAGVLGVHDRTALAAYKIAREIEASGFVKRLYEK